MKFIRTKKMNIKVSQEQEKQLSSQEKIKRVIHDDDVIAFDIVYNNEIIGFAMLKEFEKCKFFLWDYAIDYKCQNQGLGKQALIELIKYLKENYNCTLITTTYKWGNIPAKHLYERVGFAETEVVDENDVHEVNMTLDL